MDLVIMAAGMGSRFGGLKQMTSMDNHGNFIIDYSVFDAITEGFQRVIFIIRKENEKAFRETVGDRIGTRAKVEYVFQENDAITDDRTPLNRKKPLGTAHAILCCKDVVKEPFMIINADDFYGRGSFKIAKDFIVNGCTDTAYGCIAYEAGKTMTNNGSVKRGICNVREGNVIGITESSIISNNGTIDATPLDGSASSRISPDTPVSMNMFILSPSVFTTLEDGFHDFLEHMKDPMKDEYLLPDVISGMVRDGKINLKLLQSSETWFGVTYPEDKDGVVESIKRMVSEGRYPKDLWF